MDSPVDPAAPPRRISFFRTPEAWGLGLAWLAALLVAFSRQAHPRDSGTPGWVFLLIAASMLAAVLWRNRALLRASAARRRIGVATLNALEVVAMLFLCSVVGGLLYAGFGGYDDYAMRARTSELILEAAAARTAVSENAARTGTLQRSGDSVAPPVGRRVSESLVGKDGAIVLYSAGLGALVALLPAISSGAVHWSCDGYPRKLVPASCRPEAAGRTSLDSRIDGSPREHALEMLEAAKPLQASVAKGAKMRSTLKDRAKSHQLQPQGPLDFGYLDADGTIALYSDRHGVFLLLEPELKDGAMNWRCKVYPADAAVPGCSAGTPAKSPG